MRASGAFLMGTLLLAACGTKTQAPANASVGAATGTQSASVVPADAVNLPLKEFMGHVMQFGGDSIWKWQGYISDKTGEHALAPKNDKEWEEAESGALTLAEITNLLMLPGRRVDDPRWDKAVAGVRDVALRAAKAAEQKNNDAFFTAGGDLDEACEACHVKFIPNYQGPTAPKADGNSAAAASK